MDNAVLRIERNADGYKPELKTAVSREHGLELLSKVHGGDEFIKVTASNGYIALIRTSMISGISLAPHDEEAEKAIAEALRKGPRLGEGVDDSLLGSMTTVTA